MGVTINKNSTTTKTTALERTSVYKLKYRIGLYVNLENIKWSFVDLYFLCLKRFLVTLFYLVAYFSLCG